MISLPSFLSSRALCSSASPFCFAADSVPLPVVPQPKSRRAPLCRHPQTMVFTRSNFTRCKWHLCRPAACLCFAAAPLRRRHNNNNNNNNNHHHRTVEVPPFKPHRTGKAAKGRRGPRKPEPAENTTFG
jgi:hypothetical protein